MWHVCEPLSLDELKEAFNGPALNVAVIDKMELRDELLSCCSDCLLEDCDLLVS